MGTRISFEYIHPLNILQKWYVGARDQVHASWSDIITIVADFLNPIEFVATTRHKEEHGWTVKQTTDVTERNIPFDRLDAHRASWRYELNLKTATNVEQVDRILFVNEMTLESQKIEMFYYESSGSVLLLYFSCRSDVYDNYFTYFIFELAMEQFLEILKRNYSHNNLMHILNKKALGHRVAFGRVVL